MNKLKPISKEKQLQTYGAGIVATLVTLIPFAIKAISGAIALTKLIKSRKGEVKDKTTSVKFDTTDNDNGVKVVERFLSY
ncbi:Uncharacterised protein [Mycoplasmopsis californica]|uniref:Uncharacterized protein n=1 Tax=Mycoplasmopsis equigenitalium TaxID=114883 RepID=A0ABY5J596_9BACT|nr:hypothetical protein [Mycoplasmopsis equigenitalium]UUD37056.1 hypothetical protein NPA09_00560 [Mycoplasmopsis equigenitalium]VEU69644.1 Uncharacterised protein [Mycoplasmopsis californica]